MHHHLLRALAGAACILPAAAIAAVTPGACLSPANPGQQDEFGSVIATGDFNGDRRADLAVAAPQRYSQGANPTDGGTVTVYLRQGDGSLLFDREFSYAESGANFGAALAAGRLAKLDEPGATFDRDALVIGIPGAAVDGVADAGRVRLAMRSDNGVWFMVREYTQDTPGVPETLEADDNFGAALAVGQFNGDDRPDLAIGAPGETINGAADAGAVIVLYGTAADGVGTAQTLLMHQNLAALDEQASAGDRFGSVLAAGDIRNDGHDSLPSACRTKTSPPARATRPTPA